MQRQYKHLTIIRIVRICYIKKKSTLKYSLNSSKIPLTSYLKELNIQSIKHHILYNHQNTNSQKNDKIRYTHDSKLVYHKYPQVESS